MCAKWFFSQFCCLPNCFHAFEISRRTSLPTKQERATRKRLDFLPWYRSWATTPDQSCESISCVVAQRYFLILSSALLSSLISDRFPWMSYYKSALFSTSYGALGINNFRCFLFSVPYRQNILTRRQPARRDSEKRQGIEREFRPVILLFTVWASTSHRVLSLPFSSSQHRNRLDFRESSW